MVENALVKIVILGSCRHEPYEVLAVPKKNPKWNTEEGYELASKKFYPAIEKADEIWIYMPDRKIGEHTARDIEYALKKGKKIRFISKFSDKFIIDLITVNAPYLLDILGENKK